MDYKIIKHDQLSEDVKMLLSEAVTVREHAYCPYSNFAVGAAIKLEDTDKVFSGCNIENATLGPSICAERTAICKAVSEGNTKIKQVAVVANQLKSFTAPCGVCRQTLSEFRGKSGDMEVYLAKPELKEVLCTKLSDLLPLSFVSFTKDNGVS